LGGPLAVFSVGVSASPIRTKISVGTSPWKDVSADVNLASLCEKYGGGGQPGSPGNRRNPPPFVLIFGYALVVLARRE
jgi:hypothetical protein